MHKFKTVPLLKGIEDNNRWSLDLIIISDGTIYNRGYINLNDKDYHRKHALKYYHNLEEKLEIKNWIKTEKLKHRLCKCGCGKEIQIKSYQIFKGIPEFIQGHNKSFKGKHHSKETKERLREINLNKKLSEETIFKIKKSLEGIFKGEHHSPNTEFKKGIKHPNWKGGESRSRFATKEWRMISNKIRKRDGFICQYCGGEHSIKVHHIIPFGISADNDPSNLVTLCKKCHTHIESNWNQYVNYFQINIIQNNLKFKEEKI